MPGAYLPQMRRAHGAPLRGILAARMEHTAGRQIDGGRQIPFQDDPLFFGMRRRIRHGGEQRVRIRMQRVAEQFLRFGLFHDMAQIHDAHSVGYIFYHAHVMGDEQKGNLILFAQILQQVDDLGLDGNIQRRNRLVADNNFGIQDQCPRQAGPLPLPAGKFVGIAVEMLEPQPHLFHNLQSGVHARLTGADLMDLQRFRQDVPHPLLRVQRGVGVLKDHLDLTPHFDQPAGLHRRHVLIQHLHRAARRLGQVGQRAPQCAFAAAGFAHKAVNLALVQGNIDAVDRLYLLFRPAQNGAAHRKIFLYLSAPQNHFRSICHFGSPLNPLCSRPPADTGRRSARFCNGSAPPGCRTPAKAPAFPSCTDRWHTGTWARNGSRPGSG